MIFSAYHYLIWEDGTYKQMLEDTQIGWHSGNWEVNTSSISICFVGTYTDSNPSKESINTAKEIISKYPKDIKILGHREVYENTICPGNTFLGSKGWKKSL
jgi:N-acetyl-anhydromuramyl-L-alanine amidase AmpD